MKLSYLKIKKLPAITHRYLIIPTKNFSNLFSNELNMRLTSTLLLFGIIFSSSCVSTRHIADKQEFNRLKFLSEYDIPYNKEYQNTIIGGLSGIDHESQKNVYYVISDDRSERNPARFYKAKIIINNNKNQKLYP